MVSKVVEVDFAGRDSIVDMVSHITDLIEEDNIKALAIVVVDKEDNAHVGVGGLCSLLEVAGMGTLLIKYATAED